MVLVAGGEPVTVFAVCGTPPAIGVTVYEVIALPPFDGAVHDTVACPSPAVALTPVGAAGTVGPVGVTAAEAAESGPVPIAFVARTRNVYALPFVRPVTAVLVAGAVTVTGACGVDPS